MHPITVVVAQSDCIVAEHLAANLHAHFKNVAVARDVEEIRHHVLKDVADVVIIDLDVAEPQDVKKLVNEFHHVGIICTHRSPDEEMWRRCLEMGALDCCSCCDVQGIVRAARRHSERQPNARSTAA